MALIQPSQASFLVSRPCRGRTRNTASFIQLGESWFFPGVPLTFAVALCALFYVMMAIFLAKYLRERTDCEGVQVDLHQELLAYW